VSQPVTYVLLSGSTGGRQIKVAATATPGTLIHATGISATIYDELELLANNTQAAEVKLTIEWGDVTSPDDLIEVTIPGESGDVLIVVKKPIAGTGAAARNVRAFAATANVINISGHVLRIGS
jgi:hypothetical protein